MINRGDNLPNPSSVVRYIGYAKMRRDEDDNLLGPAPAAFQQKPNQDYLSVTWCEYFAGSANEQLRCAIEAIRDSNIQVKPKACFCVAITADLKAVAAEYNATTREIYFPEEDNPAHAGIYGIPPDELKLLEKLSSEAWGSFLTKDDADALAMPQTGCRESNKVD